MPLIRDISNPAYLIADAAQRFRNSRDWTDHIDIIMAQVGEGLGLSRVFLFQVHELPSGALGQTCRADWAAPGLNQLKTDERNIAEPILQNDALMKEWAERRRRGEMIQGHTRDLTGYLRQDFEYQQIKSYISFPIWVNGVWWGHIGFDDCLAERDWSVAEQSVLRTLGYLIGDAVEMSASSLVMSEATRLAMLNTAPDGVIVADEAGAVLEFNPAAESILGRKQAEVHGRRVVDLLIPPERRATFARLFARLQRGRANKILGHRTETVMLHADGRHVPVELAITEIRHTGRKLFVAYIRDLTEVKKTAAQVERQREALHQSEKLTALGSLLAGVAHELNNPLSVVVGRAIMLEEQEPDTAKRSRLGKLREAAERCAKIAKTFLAMARQSPAVRAPVALNKVILAALDLVSYQLRTGGVQTRLDLDEELPVITADFDQLVQVFVNLFINAENAMREMHDERVLTVATHTAADGRMVVAEVADTGPGIKPELRARIFEPFFTTKSVGAGTGLGLSVSFGMVTTLGGNLELVDGNGGARFRLTLPVGAKTEASARAETKEPESRKGRKVLVVDDEPEVVSLLRDILEQAGHTVDQAEHGLEALMKAGAADYDAIFCDLRMPGLDGRGLRRRLAAEHPAYDKRLIFVTGDLVHLSTSKEGIDGCAVIEKPFYASRVLAELERVTTINMPRAE
jgi:PAS domain S-box-containing protein